MFIKNDTIMFARRRTTCIKSKGFPVLCIIKRVKSIEKRQKILGGNI